MNIRINVRIKDNTNEYSAINTIRTCSKDEAETHQNRILNDRKQEVGDIISLNGEKTSSNGAMTTVAGGVGAIGGIATACFASTGIGLALIGLGTLAAGYGEYKVNKGEVKQNEANNYTGSDAEQNDTIPKKLANLIFGNSTDNIPSEMDLSTACSELKDNSNGEYTDLYIYKDDTVNESGEAVNNNAVLGHLDVVKTDLKTYNPQKSDNVEVEGYEKKSYSFANEYTQVFNEFSETTAKDGKLTSEEVTQIENIASAIQKEGFEDEKEIFDISGDGYLNTADLVTIDYAIQGKEDELSQIIYSWEANNGDLEQAAEKLYNIDTSAPRSEVRKEIQKNININDFDANQDNFVDEKDLMYFKKTTEQNESINDINKDGEVTEADKDILKSYLKANMDRLTSLEKEASEIRKVTFANGDVNNEYKRLLGAAIIEE